MEKIIEGAIKEDSKFTELMIYLVPQERLEIVS